MRNFIYFTDDKLSGVENSGHIFDCLYIIVKQAYLDLFEQNCLAMVYLTGNYFRILYFSEGLGSGLQTMIYDKDICFPHLNLRHNIKEFPSLLCQNLEALGSPMWIILFIFFSSIFQVICMGSNIYQRWMYYTSLTTQQTIDFISTPISYSKAC